MHFCLSVADFFLLYCEFYYETPEILSPSINKLYTYARDPFPPYFPVWGAHIGTIDMCEAIKQMREHSRAAGILEGRAEGRLDTLVSLWKKKRLTLEEAAEEAEMTVDEFVEKNGVKVLMN